MTSAKKCFTVYPVYVNINKEAIVMVQDLFVGSSTDGQIPKMNTKQTVPNALQKKSDYLTKSRTQGMCNKNRSV